MASLLPSAAAAILPFILSYFQGNRQPALTNIPTASGAQQDLLDAIIADIMGGGGRFGVGGELFDQGFVQPAIENFETRVAPSIRGQFASRGVGGGKLEADAIARAGRQVEQDIISQAARTQQGLIGQALGQKQFAPTFIRPQQGALERSLEQVNLIGAQAGGDILNQILQAASGALGFSTQAGPQLPAPSLGASAGSSRVGFRG